jgi:hypothetical protein
LWEVPTAPLDESEQLVSGSIWFYQCGKISQYLVNLLAILNMVMREKSKNLCQELILGGPIHNYSVHINPAHDIL